MKPPQDIDSLFEEFVQELPSDYEALAQEFKAFVRARKVRSVAQLLQLVLLYCGLDLSLRGCTVHAIPLPPAKAAEARRQVQQRARKKGRQARAASLFLSGWVLIFTGAVVELLPVVAADDQKVSRQKLSSGTT